MINILHFIDTYNVGGPGKTIINSAKYIDNQSFKLFIAAFDNRKAKSVNEFSDAVIKEGIPYLSLPDTRGIALEHITILKSYIKKNNITIIHAHGYKTDIISLILKVLKTDLFVVTTHHGWIKNDLLAKFYVYIDFILCRFFDGVIVVSKELKDQLPKNVRRSDRCKLIHNALVIHNYQKANLRKDVRQIFGIKDTTILIGVIGRLSIEKGCFDILDAFYKIRSKFNNIRLIYIGKGPLLKDLQKKLCSHNTKKDVILAGYHNPVQPFYEALDIMVCPSHTEGLSNTILEAMAYQLPIVATRVGGNPEIIVDRYSGILVDPHNPSQLEMAILEIIQDKKLRTEVAEKGFYTIKNRFSFFTRMEKIEDFYNTLIKRNTSLKKLFKILFII